MQLHFSVDSATGARLAKEAARRGMTLSAYLASLVMRASPRSWPPGYLERVVGSCGGKGLIEPTDFPPDEVEALDG